jgi:hypothetical protein
MTDNNQTNNVAVSDMKLELVPVPVSDIDRAKAFYVEKIWKSDPAGGKNERTFLFRNTS